MSWVQRFIIALLILAAMIALLISTEADLIMAALQASSKASVAMAGQLAVPTPTPQPLPVVIMAPTQPTPTNTPAPRPTSTLAPTHTPQVVAMVPTRTPAPTNPPTPAVTPALVCTDTAGKVIEDSLTSRVLGHKISTQVYLPPCYAPAKQQYPTLYLIQGRFYIWGEWEDDGAVDIANSLIMSKTVAPFIMVMPFNDIDMGNASKYLYSGNGPDSWEDFIVNELVPYIDKSYATARHRDMRAIGGISRGGYWATVIGFSHPELFSIIGGHSPAIAAEFFDMPADFSVANYAPSPAQLRTQRVWLDVGNDDQPSYSGPHDLYEKLLGLGVPVRFSIGIGGHTDAYWASRMKEYLLFYAETWPKK